MQFGECILDKIEGWLGNIPEQELQVLDMKTSLSIIKRCSDYCLSLWQY